MRILNPKDMRLPRQLVSLLLGCALSATVLACGGDDSHESNSQQAGGQGGGSAAGGSAGASHGGAAGQPGGAAGAGGQAGAGQGGGGAGGGTSTTSKTNKVDLLFMLDNSASMADKHAILAESVPLFISELTNPPCVDMQNIVVARPEPGEDCPAQSHRAFPAVEDIHIGIITSSLGGRGADACTRTPEANDHGRLVYRNARGGTVDTYAGKGFLAWDPGQKAAPPGEKDLTKLVSTFKEMLGGVGEEGCGYEASLESWYRFLVDPKPYESIVAVPCSSSDTSKMCRKGEGVDAELLKQRADFLRPDSLVTIVMLTDENDCSVNPMGLGYIVMQVMSGHAPFHLARGTKECETDPSSPECMSCWSSRVDKSKHPECAGEEIYKVPDGDHLNLRCYHQKQRFGKDFLYPVDRYIKGLTERVLDDGSINPLFCGKISPDGKKCLGEERPRDLVMIEGIVGVPWQDIARDPTDLSKGFVDPSKVDWKLVMGDPKHYVDPTDPLMVESVQPRKGKQPVTGEPVGLPPGGQGLTNTVNGAERPATRKDDLQYACVFDLPRPEECYASNRFCDCLSGNEQGNPLCWNGQGYSTTQLRAKAYPGIRHLQVLQGVGAQGLVASICAFNTKDDSRKDFGYRPALDLLMRKMAAHLNSNED